MKQLSMKKTAFLFLSTCAFLLACGTEDYSGDEEIFNVKISGPFLLNNGERLIFSPECDYNGVNNSMRCGLAYKGPETHKQTYSYCPGGDRGCDSKTVVFDNTDADFSGLKVTWNSTQTVQLDSLDLIEADTNGIVDFILRDQKENEVHLQYNMSSILEKVKDSLIVDDGGIYFNTQYYLKINEKCLLSQGQMLFRDSTVFISDSLITACFTAGDYVSQGKMPVGAIPFSGTIDSCEVSSGVTDPSPIDPMTLFGITYYKYCKPSIMILEAEFYRPTPLIYYKP